jgi:hypothetical protein
MDKLPSEILNKIFIQLDLQQRLVCLRVCRSWWNVVDKCSLFYDIHLDETQNKDRFDRFINKFEQSPERASQVQVLDMVVLLKTRFNKRKLLHIFPNTRVMRMKSSIGAMFQSKSRFTTPIDLSHAKPKVEVLFDANHCELASQILGSNLGGRLGVLYLDFHFIPGSHAIMSQLKELPVLKQLSLRHPTVSLDILEAIHTNVPSIEDFTLRRAVIKAGTMPSNIQPAVAMTTFNIIIGMAEDIETHMQFYQYIAKKYINIMDVEYIDRSLRRYHFDEMKQIYLNGLVDFLKLIGPNRSDLTLYTVPDEVDPFEALDAANSKCKTLWLWECEGGTLFEYLSQSKQSTHIVELHTDSTRLHSIHPIKNMMALTTLEIVFRKPDLVPVSLANCLSACPPSLKSLFIEIDCLAVSPFKTKLDSIENLTIICDRLTSDLGDIVSFCFPNLVGLKLDGELTENITLNLQNPKFQSASICTMDGRLDDHSTHALSFKSPMQPETQYYIYDDTIADLVPYEDVQYLQMLSIVSFTSKKLDISNDIKVLPFE